MLFCLLLFIILITFRSVQSQDPRIVNTISIDTFSKILNQQNQINARDK